MNDYNEDTDEKIDEAASKILADLRAGLADNSTDISPKTAKLLNLDEIAKKDVDEMTSKEKIDGFCGALVVGNHALLKALSEGTDGAGGYTVPDEVYRDVVRELTDSNVMRNEVTIVPMRTDVLKIPKLTSGPLIAWGSENATISTTTAQFSQSTLTAKKMSGIMYLSSELQEDANIDVSKLIIKLFAERIADEEDRVITAGNGTTQPQGFQTAGTISTISCSGNLTFDDIIDLIYGLPAKYEKKAKFYIHRNNIKELRKLKDAQNRYLWMDNVVPNQPATFYGRPIVECNYLPESEIYYGDLRMGYWLGDKKRIQVKVSTDTSEAFLKDQIAIRVTERIGGNLVLPSAMRCLNNIP